MSKSANSLRKAAILVSSLDRQSADALLDSMPDELSGRVRQAVLNLAEIEPSEQQAIIAEFLQGQGAAATGGVEFEPSLVRRFSSAGHSEVAPQPARSEPAAPFGFLHAATSETLCKFLQRENPQTAALVLAHLPPARAADVLAGFQPSFQADVLKRVAALEETSPEVLQELEQSLEHLLASEAHATRRQAIGLAAVGAIFSAAPRELRQGMLSNLARTDAGLVERLKSAEDEDFGGDAPARPAKALRFPFFWSRPAAPAMEEAADDDVFDDETEPEPEEDNDVEEVARVIEPSLPTVEFEDFLRFDNRSLALVLKAADPRIAILALTGARRELVERLLNQIPAQEAKDLRKRMELSGPLRLRDVEVAQRQLALVASRLAARGDIKLPVVRRFAAAA